MFKAFVMALKVLAGYAVSGKASFKIKRRF